MTTLLTTTTDHRGAAPISARAQQVRSVYDRQEPQYMTAIWAATEEQREVARRIAAEGGKALPVLRARAFYDAEPNHQQFFGPPKSEESTYYRLHGRAGAAA